MILYIIISIVIKGFLGVLSTPIPNNSLFVFFSNISQLIAFVFYYYSKN